MSQVVETLTPGPWMGGSINPPPAGFMDSCTVRSGMEMVAEEIDIGTRSPTILLHTDDADELGAHPLDRVEIRENGRTHTGIAEVTDELVEPGRLGVTRPLGHVSGTVGVTLAPKPDSVYYIKKKLDDIELERDELETIVQDINADRLNDVELGAFVCGTYTNGLSLQETMHLTECMANAGEFMDWTDGPIADKHSIGGVAGNRVTPIVVPIVAAAGIKIPKTSSRAVTSPAGTADTLEVLCDVEFTIDEIRSIVDRTNGCMVWGGAVNLSPVDDKIIRAETPLSVDPPGQIIASVLSKKQSAGSTHVVIDIPYGEGSKVESLSAARELAEDFKRVGAHIGMTIECTITQGQQPIGQGIGPVLEAKDVLQVLENDGPVDLRLKSLRIADILLEICEADERASDILESGRALEKFREIIDAQGGDPTIEPADLDPGRLTETVAANRSGLVNHVNNRLISELARRAGAPKDKRAGLFLHRSVGDQVDEGDDLFTIHAEKADKLDDAVSLEDRVEAIRVRSRDEALVERL